MGLSTNQLSVFLQGIKDWHWLYIHIPGYSLVTNFFPGQILVWFLSIFCRFVHFKIKITFQEKNLPLHVFIFESWWICPGISALFPGISAQENRHIFTQSRVRSAQKARNPKLTTIIKKWPFPAPSQEIRPKGRNLGNGHLFVSFRTSRYVSTPISCLRNMNEPLMKHEWNMYIHNYACIMYI